LGKAGQRRQKKLAEYLVNLIRTDKNRFIYEWERRVKNWLIEIHQRADMLRGVESTHERVFGVLEQVDRLLNLCGPEVDELVGASTRDTLIHESCKAFSLAIDPKMYRLYNRHQYTKN
jgi:hypothetical protein